MATYTTETAPTIKDESGHMLSFLELRVCLDCGKACDLTNSECPHCNSSLHTRTVLIISTTLSAEKRPIVKVANFGNHE